MQKDEVFDCLIQVVSLFAYVNVFLYVHLCLGSSRSCRCLLIFSFKPAAADMRALLQIEKEFPQILSIHDSLKKFVFEHNAKNKPQVLAAVKEMRGR